MNFLWIFDDVTMMISPDEVLMNSLWIFQVYKMQKFMLTYSSELNFDSFQSISKTSENYLILSVFLWIFDDITMIISADDIFVNFLLIVQENKMQQLMLTYSSELIFYSFQRFTKTSQNNIFLWTFCEFLMMSPWWYPQMKFLCTLNEFFRSTKCKSSCWHIPLDSNLIHFKVSQKLHKIISSCEFCVNVWWCHNDGISLWNFYKLSMNITVRW